MTWVNNEIGGCVSIHPGPTRGICAVFNFGTAMIWKALVSILLAASCMPAAADWIRVSTSQQSVFYIDSARSPMVGNNVTIWVLRDHKDMKFGQARVVLSSKDQIEVDCSGRRIRRIFSSDHPRHMGKGKAIRSEHGPMSWNVATPNTPVSRIVDLACVQS